ncbi:199L [Invertebrate iridescent virus Kaz2018]|nr:199L [Invertebrate iridescent virus Kaz2018]
MALSPLNLTNGLSSILLLFKVALKSAFLLPGLLDIKLFVDGLKVSLTSKYTKGICSIGKSISNLSLGKFKDINVASYSPVGASRCKLLYVT